MKLSRKYILYILVLAVLVSAVVVVGSVYAKYIGDISGTGEITLTPPQLLSAVSEPVNEGDGLSKYTVSNSNSSSMPAYIRCAVVVNWIDGDGNIWAVPPVEYTDYEITYSQVESLNGYYYYDGVASPGQTFPIWVNQLKTKVGYTLHVQILAESIMTVPESAVKNSWGVEYVGGTWQTVSP